MREIERGGERKGISRKRAEIICKRGGDREG